MGLYTRDCKTVRYIFDRTSSSIPISFLLGLYVVTVVKRWWEQFENVAWPDNLLYLTSAFFRGHDEQQRILRRTIVRYSVASAALAWRNISSRVLKRFPTVEHLMQAGLLTKDELAIYKETNAPFGRWFIPINWIQEIIVEAKNSDQLDTAQCKQLMVALHAYKDKFIRLFVCDWISIPLVYTQVCTVATYGYFGLCLLGRQFLRNEESVALGWRHLGSFVNYDLYVPVFTILEFFFYMGWLKVAERIMHPFGEEDDDFELNYILDRHLFVGFMIVDGFHGKKPEMKKDAFWDKEPWIPHTKASGKIKDRRPHATFGVNLPFSEMEIQGDLKEKHI